MPVHLDFYALCFRFLARERISFPAGKAGNVLRGAFGSILRKQLCRPQCSGASHCEFASECAYAAIFEPRASGRFASPRRPFVFRADSLDGQRIEPGHSFEFGMNLFDRNHTTLDSIVKAFSELTTLGANRSVIEYTEVQIRSMSLDLTPGTEPIHRVRIVFKTPTELKSNNEVVDRPDFPILYSRAVERVSALSAQPLDLGPCPDVRLVECSLTESRVERHSSRTGQRHRLGGFLGYAVYDGDLRQCLPVLEAAEFTGVGRHTTWGNGRIEVATLA